MVSFIEAAAPYLQEPKKTNPALNKAFSDLVETRSELGCLFELAI